MTTAWGIPTGFYDPFFTDPLLGDFDVMDWDVGMGPTEWGMGAGGGGATAGGGWPQLAGRGGEARGGGAQAGQQAPSSRAQRRANRRTARVNLVQEEGQSITALTLYQHRLALSCCWSSLRLSACSVRPLSSLPCSTVTQTSIWCAWR